MMCSVCLQERGTEFYADRRNKSGRRSICKVCVAVYNKAYKSVRQPALARAVTKYRARYPEKKLAQGRLNDAIRYGHIVKPDVCSRCGKKGRIDAHHSDYSKPLDVEWLCRSCHVGEHKS
jgi:hypothetical protein